MPVSFIGRAALVLGLCATAPGAFAADWPVVRANPRNTAAAAEEIKPPFRPVWTLKNATNEALLVAGGKLYYTKRRPGGLRDLMQADIKTGTEKRLVANVAQTGAVAPALGRIFTVLRAAATPSSVSRLGANLWQSSIAAVDLRSGKVLWEHPIGEHPQTPAISPLTTDGRYVYLVNIPYWVPGDPVGPASFICLDAKTGERVGFYDWDRLSGSQVGVTAGPPAIDAAGRAAIALGYQGPDTYAGQLWVFQPGTGVSDGPVVRIGDPDGASAHQGAIGWPVVAGGGVLAFKPGDRIGAWTISRNGDFSERWTARASAGKALAVTGGARPAVIVADNGARKLTALAVDTGKPAWSRTANATGLGACAGSIVFVPCQEKRPVKPGARGRTDILDGVLYALDARTGKTLWSVRKSDVTYNPPVVAAGRLLVSDTDGFITCYAPGA